MTLFRTLCIFIICSAITTIIKAEDKSQSDNQDSDLQLRIIFDDKYKQWLEAINKESPSSLIGMEELYEIVNLGPRVIPYLINKLENIKESGCEQSGVITSIWIIAFKKFKESEWPEGEYGFPNTEARLLIEWWRYKRVFSDYIIKKTIIDYKRAIKDANGKEANMYNKEIVDMGIESIPYLIGEINNNYDKVIPMIKNILRIDVLAGKEYTIESILKWWDEEKEKWTLPAPPRRSEAFKWCYGEMNRHKENNDMTEVEKGKERISALGYDILPLIIDKIKQGDTQMLRVVQMIAGKDIGGKKPTFESIIKWWDEEGHKEYLSKKDKAKKQD